MSVSDNTQIDYGTAKRLTNKAVEPASSALAVSQALISTDPRAAAQAQIGSSMELTPNRQTLTATMELNETGAPDPVGGQLESVKGLTGRGGRYQTEYRYDFGPGVTTGIKARNTVGQRISGLTVVMTPQSGQQLWAVDADWMGGEERDGSGPAPALFNHVADLWLENGGLKLGQNNDSHIENIVIRNIDPDLVAVDARGSGGYMGLRDIYAHTGKVLLAAKDFNISSCVINEVHLEEASYCNGTVSDSHFLGIRKGAIFAVVDF